MQQQALASLGSQLSCRLPLGLKDKAVFTVISCLNLIISQYELIYFCALYTLANWEKEKNPVFLSLSAFHRDYLSLYIEAWTVVQLSLTLNRSAQ